MILIQDAFWLQKCFLATEMLLKRGFRGKEMRIFQSKKRHNFITVSKATGCKSLQLYSEFTNLI